MPTDYVCIASHQAEELTSTSKFKVRLPKVYQDVKAVRLVSAEIPNTMSTIDVLDPAEDLVFNTYIYWCKYDPTNEGPDPPQAGFGAWNNIAIPPGNYDVTSLVTEINERLTGTGITCTYNSAIKLIGFTANFEFFIALMLPTNQGGREVRNYQAVARAQRTAKLLGLRSILPIRSKTLSINTEYIAGAYEPDVTPDDHVLLRIPEIGDLVSMPNTSIPGFFSKLSIPSVLRPGEIAYYDSTEAHPLYKYIYSKLDLYSVTIEIYDFMQRIADLNGGPVSFILEIRYGPDEPNGDVVYELAKLQLQKRSKTYPWINSSN